MKKTEQSGDDIKCRVKFMMIMMPISPEYGMKLHPVEELDVGE